ncbi:hypothetical protein KVR01_010325 [Diaporthe batatas]|uniref:uncharacterized protein n=1 Tax=Diaporthe batatas TaxID=748121 RepID=UPI001D04111B|nr:uncharacterized protein KVR01_010325 [Diaporthe batatas]KAG8159688.1 hypothetical protein KVR01_010325 [Diaporthe batatas]
MEDNEPSRWLPGLSQLPRRLTLSVGTVTPSQTQDLSEKAPLSSCRRSSLPSTSHPYLHQGQPTAVHPGLAGPGANRPAFQKGVEYGSGSSSSDDCSSASYESSTSTTGSHLHIGVPSIPTVPPKLGTRSQYPSEDGNRSFFEIQRFETLEAKWKKLETKRDEVRGMREDILRLRRKTQRRRLRKDSADNSFMSFLRPLLVSTKATSSLTTSHSRLRELFECMQKARDKCQDVETTLELMEENLGYAEDELNGQEKSLIDELRPDAKIATNAKAPEPTKRRSSSPLPTSLLGIGAEGPEDFHPLYKKFISEVGYLQLAEEHHRDLLFRKESIEREQDHLKLAQDYRPPNDRRLETQDLTFLKDFGLHMQESISEMEKLQVDVERLRQMCRNRGVFPKHAPLHEAYRFERDLGDDIFLSPDPVEDKDAFPLFTSRFGVLLYSPKHLIEEPPITAKAALRRAVSLKDGDILYPFKQEMFATAAKEYLIEHLIQDAKDSDKTDFINRWLLHRLRTSAVEVELLYSLFVSSSSLTILDFEQWQQDVLFYWTRDDQARLPPERFNGPVTSECTEGSSVLADSSVKPGLQSDPTEGTYTNSSSTS